MVLKAVEFFRLESLCLDNWMQDNGFDDFREDLEAD